MSLTSDASPFHGPWPLVLLVIPFRGFYLVGVNLVRLSGVSHSWANACPGLFDRTERPLAVAQLRECSLIRPMAASSSVPTARTDLEGSLTRDQRLNVGGVYSGVDRHHLPWDIWVRNRNGLASCPSFARIGRRPRVSAGFHSIEELQRIAIWIGRNVADRGYFAFRFTLFCQLSRRPRSVQTARVPDRRDTRGCRCSSRADSQEENQSPVALCAIPFNVVTVRIYRGSRGGYSF